MRVLAVWVFVAVAPLASAQAGRFAVAGTNPDGSTYVGTLTLVPAGHAFRATWQTGGAPVEGIGLRHGRVVTVAYGASADDVCGVVAYWPENDGFRADWAMAGQDAVGFEVAEPAGAEGTYRVHGRPPQGGEPYVGTMTLRAGAHATWVRWDIGGVPYEGIGLAHDGVLGIAYDVRSVPAATSVCSVAVYVVGADGTLDGTWTGPGLDGVGTERARPLGRRR